MTPRSLILCVVSLTPLSQLDKNTLKIIDIYILKILNLSFTQQEVSESRTPISRIQGSNLEKREGGDQGPRMGCQRTRGESRVPKWKNVKGDPRARQYDIIGRERSPES